MCPARRTSVLVVAAVRPQFGNADLLITDGQLRIHDQRPAQRDRRDDQGRDRGTRACERGDPPPEAIGHRDALALTCTRSEEPTSELQSLMRISYAVFCLKKKQRLPTDT